MYIRIFLLALFGSLPVFAGEGVKVINESNFKSETGSGVVLVDFYGSWCGPCQRLSPVLDELANEVKGKAKIVKVDIDQSKALADAHGVKGVPTLILFKNGEEKGRLVGFRDQKTLEEFISSGGSK